MPYCDSNTTYYKKNTVGTPYCTFVGDKQDENWNFSQEKLYRGPPHISKLRTILSETIANVTKANQLQKGESVELTLEIELMRTKNNTPTNSLIEVTIIQHNKNKEQEALGHEAARYLTNKMPFEVTVQKSESESPSEKRRNWFHRVIARPYDENIKTTHGVEQNIEENPIRQLHKNCKQNESKRKNPRSNFVTILPEKTPLSFPYTKGYQRVSPSQPKQNKPWNLVTPRKVSLVKKLSNMFLPTRNASKSQVVQTALTALKKEVDSMKLVIDKDGTHQNVTQMKKATAQNLGKLVSNILGDAMEKSDEVNRSKYTYEDRANTLPVKCQNGFERVVKSKDTNITQDLNNKKLPLKLKMITESHSDTCCLKPIYTTSEPSLQTSVSLSDCRSMVGGKSPPETLVIGDFKHTSTKGRHNKPSRETKHERGQKRDAKGDAENLEKKETPNNKHKKSLRSRKSVVNWGGHIIQVNKKKKTRIEHLIVKELQNLALKEGMECDVLPLPSTDNGIKHINTVAKISSFICEIDVSDKAFEKEMRKRKSLNKKLNRPIHESLERINCFYTKNNGHTTKKHKATKLKRTRKEDRVTRTGCKRLHQNLPGLNNMQEMNKNNAITKEQKSNRDLEKSKAIYVDNREDNEVMVTYLNKNVKNWSAESTNVHFESPKMRYSQNTETTSTEVQTDKKYNIRSVVSSGFVKVIKSDDSTWHKYLREQDESGSGNSTQIMTVTSTETAIKFHSETSNELEKNIELEVDINDLESILKEAKRKQTTDRYVINAKWNQGNKKRKKVVRMTGKNSPEYTNNLLSNAVKKLEDYVGIKHRRR
uniref:Uncharacterized protein n=1 Tax=Graphocephala atropunctata TaxID=36148 RepID=A0A1B6KEW0_9HEMI